MEIINIINALGILGGFTFLGFIFYWTLETRNRESETDRILKRLEKLEEKLK